MSRRAIECTTCGEEHRTQYGAWQCCPPVQDAYDDNPDIIRSSD